MAKENTVFLYGRVFMEPKININTEGNYLSGKIILHTLRRSYATKELLLRGNPRMDYLCVFSRNGRLIERSMVSLEQGDMVLVKGTLCTKETVKKFICPHCNHEITRDGVVIYVDPIFVKRCESGVPEKQAYDIIKESDEISNLIKIMGTLCREPLLYENPQTKKMECDFQIAANRNRHILEDNPLKRTDYPWVKSFGPKAKEYSEALHMNSSVYIDGAIQARTIEREFVCEECGEVFKRSDNATEIIPYNIEYLDDCILPVKESDEEDEIHGE